MIKASVVWYRLTWSRGAWFILNKWFFVWIQKQRQPGWHTSHTRLCTVCTSWDLNVAFTRWHIRAKTSLTIRFTNHGVECLLISCSVMLNTPMSSVEFFHQLPVVVVIAVMSCVSNHWPDIQRYLKILLDQKTDISGSNRSLKATWNILKCKH